MELYQIVIESAMSEQLARVYTMRLATDNARKLVDKLTLDYNLARSHAVTGERVPLFHPVQQRWRDHFVWSKDDTQIVGVTASGRATVDALRMNNPTIVRARRRWVAAGWHPPRD